VTEIFFYITGENAASAPMALARRIAEKAMQSGRRVYVHAGDADFAARLDEHWWAEPATSFLPHARLGDAADHDATPVVIGHGDDPGMHHDVLINLSTSVPDFFSRFQRVAELVTGDENARKAARARWKYYRDRGYPVHDHRLGG
jgi:DNA polymerase-3 subunit chi